MSDARVSIGADLADFTRGVGGISASMQTEARKGAAAMQSEVGRGSKAAAASAVAAAKEAGSAWQGVGSIIAGSLGATAIKGALGSLYSYASAVAESRTELLRLQEATNVSAEVIGGLSVALDRTGGDIGRVGGALQNFGRLASEAADGGGKAAGAFSSLGVTLRDETTGALRTSDELLRETLTRYQQLPESAKKAEIGTKLFGGAAGDLNVALRNGALEDWISLAEQSGAIVDETAVASTKRWNQSIADLKGSVDQFSGSFMDAFGPTAAQGIDDFAVGFTFLGHVMLGVLEETRQAAGRLGEAFSALSSGDLRGYLAAVSGQLDAGADAWSRIGGAAYDATFKHWQAREAIRASSEAVGAVAATADQATTATQRLGRATSSAADDARAQAAAERERRAAWSAMSSAVADAIDDLVTREERLERAAAERRASVSAALAAGVVDAEGAAAALGAIDARLDRDRAALDAQREAREAAAREARRRAEEDETAHQAAQHAQRVEIAQRATAQITSSAMGALRTLDQRREQSAREDLRRNQQRVQELRKSEEELLAQLEAAEDAHTAYLIQQELLRVQGQIESQEEQADIRKREIQRAARAQKAWAAMQIAVDAAAAILRAMAMLGPPPISSPAIAMIVGTAGIQTGLVASQPVPAYFRGRPGGGDALAPDESVAILHDDEAVASRAGVERLGRREIDRANRGMMDRGGDGEPAIELDGIAVGRWVTSMLRRQGGRVFGRGAGLVRSPF